MKNLKSLLDKALMLEGLSQREYKKLTKGIRVGVELELIIHEELQPEDLRTSLSKEEYESYFREFIDEEEQVGKYLGTEEGIKKWGKDLPMPYLSLIDRGNNYYSWKHKLKNYVFCIEAILKILEDPFAKASFKRWDQSDDFFTLVEKYENTEKFTDITNLFPEPHNALYFFMDQDDVIEYLYQVTDLIDSVIEFLKRYFTSIRPYDKDIQSHLEYIERHNTGHGTFEKYSLRSYIDDYMEYTPFRTLPRSLQEEIQKGAAEDFNEWYRNREDDSSDSSHFNILQKFTEDLIKNSPHYKLFLDAYKSGSIWDNKNIEDREKTSRAGQSIWKFVPDSSIGDHGIEIIPPTIPFDKFIELVPPLIWFLELHFKANEDCGYHIGISHGDTDYRKDLIDTFGKYMNKGFRLSDSDGGKQTYYYTEFVSYVMALSKGFETTFAYTPERLINEYANNVYSRMSHSQMQNFLRDSTEDILKGENEYMGSISLGHKYNELNTSDDHYRYVEVRLLGGEEGLEVLGSKSSLENYMYDAISRLEENSKIKSFKEVYKTISSLKRIFKLLDDQGHEALDEFARSNFMTRKEMLKLTPEEQAGSRSSNVSIRLNRLKDLDYDKLRQEAKDPKTSKERLRQLSTIKDHDILLDLLDNPSTPKDVIAKLRKWGYEVV